MGRRTDFYFASIKLSESLHLSASALWVLLAGTRKDSVARTCFERSWVERFGGARAIATASGRSGLYALLKAMTIGSGDEVLVTGFTCEAVPEPIQFLGARPIYVDIDRRRFAMDPAAAARAITPRTKVLIIQHTFGIPAPTEPLIALARKHGLYVIEDCALALGSQNGGKWLGGAGDAAVFSFELSKTVTAGWGGLVQINHQGKSLAECVCAVRDRGGSVNRLTGSRRLFQAGLSGVLYRPEILAYCERAIGALFLVGVFGRSATQGDGSAPPQQYIAAPADVQWRILSGQLERLDGILLARKHMAALYQDVLTQCGCGVVIPAELNDVSLIRFPLLVRQPKRFAQAFARRGVEIGRWFSQPVAVSTGHCMSRYSYQPGLCPNAEYVASHIVNLPLHERMNKQDMTVAVSCLDQYLRQYQEEREFVAASLETAMQSEAVTRL